MHNDSSAQAVVRVLLVEDEENVRLLMARCLRKAGFDVVDMGSPQAALRHVESELMAVDSVCPYDVLVTDVVMPGMSGPELVERIEARQSGLRVLFISGFAGDELVKHGMDGSKPLLRKPFSGADLVRRLQALLA